jgi:hypothetical protein
LGVLLAAPSSFVADGKEEHEKPWTFTVNWNRNFVTVQDKNHFLPMSYTVRVKVKLCDEVS